MEQLSSRRNLVSVTVWTMKHQNDYLAGPHDFWVHFWCGLVFGAILGVCIFGEVFDSAWGLATGTALFALLTAYACGRWGDRAWHSIISGL